MASKPAGQAGTWGKITAVSGGAFTLLFAISLIQGILAQRKQSKMMEEQERMLQQQSAVPPWMQGVGPQQALGPQGQQPPMYG